MSTDQFDPEQLVRIRMTVEGEPKPIYSARISRWLAEIDVAGGPVHLTIEHGDGRRVLSAKIEPWRFD